jgi:DNA-binding NarL/FixJ family response regulator
MNNVKILIADNQDLTREGILAFLRNGRYPLEIETVAFKSELIEKVSIFKPLLVIIDPDTLDFDSLSEIGQIKKHSSFTEILVITNNQEANDVQQLIDVGVNQYILKNTDEKEFSDAFAAALSGKRYLCSEILNVILNKKVYHEPSHITGSEAEIIRLIAEGLTAKEIANRKFISVHTVNTHRKNIFRKLSVNSTSELIMHSIRCGIIDTTEYYI